MLNRPARLRRLPQRSGLGLRSWWHNHVALPLDRMYEHLDDHQRDDEDRVG